MSYPNIFWAYPVWNLIRAILVYYITRSVIVFGNKLLVVLTEIRDALRKQTNYAALDEESHHLG